MSKLPPTDWNQIRNVFAAAIDFCEQLETLGYSEDARPGAVGGDQWEECVGVRGRHERLIGCRGHARCRRSVTTRHDTNNDLPYVPETARIIAAAAGVCAEFVHSDKKISSSAGIDRLTTWLGSDGVKALRATLTRP